MEANFNLPIRALRPILVASAHSKQLNPALRAAYEAAGRHCARPALRMSVWAGQRCDHRRTRAHPGKNGEDAGEGSIWSRLGVTACDQLYGWVFGPGNDATIVTPEHIWEEMAKMLERAAHEAAWASLRATSSTDGRLGWAAMRPSSRQSASGKKWRRCWRMFGRGMNKTEAPVLCDRCFCLFLLRHFALFLFV